MKNVMKRMMVLLLVMAILAGGTSCLFKSDSERFDEYIEASFIGALESFDTLTRNFLIKNPENYGLGGGEVFFAPVMPAEEINEELYQSQLDYMETLFRYDKLTEEQKIIFDIFKYNAELNIIAVKNGFEYYQNYCSGSSSVSSGFLITLAEFDFYGEHSVKDYLKLLSILGDHFDEIIKYEKEKAKRGLFMTERSLDRFVEECEKFIENTENNVLIVSFKERIDELEGLEEEKKKEYIEENKKVFQDTVIPAYIRIKEEMELLRDKCTERGLVGTDKGKAFYEYLLKGSAGTDMTINEVKTLLFDKMEECWNLMESLIEKDSTLENRLQEAKFSIEKPEEIISALKEMIKKDFPPAPEVEYTIKYVPEYLQDSLRAAFFMTPPIDAATKNVIYVNNAERYKNMDVFTNLAHEGYPGHLYQTAYYSSKQTYNVRRLLSYQGYIEGWASYVELHSYEYGGFDEDVKLMMQTEGLYNLLNSVANDIAINYDGKDLEWLKDLYEGADAKAIEEYYYGIIEEPCANMPYTIGALEIMRMRDYAKESLGTTFNLKEFHEVILDTGAVPMFILQDKVESYIKLRSQAERIAAA